METGVTCQHFPGISCCRVTIKYALYVFSNADKFFLKIKNCFKKLFYHRVTENTEVFIVCVLYRQQQSDLLCDLCDSVVQKKHSYFIWLCYMKSTSMLYPENLRIFNTPVSRIIYCPFIPSKLPSISGCLSKFRDLIFFGYSETG